MEVYGGKAEQERTGDKWIAGNMTYPRPVLSYIRIKRERAVGGSSRS